MWIFCQLVLLGIISLIFTYIDSWFGAKSVLIGGGAWLIPHLYFIWKTQRLKVVFNVNKMLKGFLLNEAIKLLLSFGIIILILLTMQVDVKGFLSGYIAMVLLSVISFFVE